MDSAVTSIFDMRDAEGLPYFDVPGDIADDPANVCEVVDRMGGQKLSGAQREHVTTVVEQAIASFFEIARTLAGEELAAVLALRVIARDAKYRPAPWLVQKLFVHRAACADAFSIGDGDQDVEPDHNFYDDPEEERRARFTAQSDDEERVRELAHELSVDARDLRAYFDGKRNRQTVRIRKAFTLQTRGVDATPSTRCA